MCIVSKITATTATTATNLKKCLSVRPLNVLTKAIWQLGFENRFQIMQSIAVSLSLHP